MASDDGEKKVLTSAPPPWHSVLLMVTFGAVFIYLMPSLEKLDEAATVETFTRVLFPEYLDLYTMAYIRLFVGLTIWWVTIQMSVFSNGWEQQPSYLPGSQLKMVPNQLKGIKTCFPFTSVSWNLLGMYFVLAGYIALEGAKNEAATISPWILRTALATWEVAAPNSLLVSAVIRYVIWPGVLRKGNSTINLKSVRNIFMHNLNAFFALSESGLLGGPPVRFTDISLAPLVGIAYVVFTWNMSMSWNKPEHGPQFIYFFFDTTLPGYTASIALIGLLVALITFFVIFSSCEHLLVWTESGIIGGLAFVVSISSMVMRFRD
uniref:Uncharacterized protein n=1 Tax=Entomoneis paludosa TaxID=265537 RepID=A0A7S2YHD4_9STRA|mmetsp:Transcript_32779/g.68365  ORF Transcript_32779/g.68365 Transcript_32779/m.68365 type:complete len:320 (+) Transcript_32779:88-1047(+)|eukprot:CAMPEP_0172458052 /NCGR_PEP_ID=MMETSP1065-20121228/25647_1 /TAXON_ID=265537 /ORGANISM="Amphiprora paludosa, Strain CCMP125" /LENGTH=319 /DNA_ID=CAMNT_0013212121 /DNA_START=52 /DNA_END=1011 /DNA_ORIENTATION=+